MYFVTYYNNGGEWLEQECLTLERAHQVAEQLTSMGYVDISVVDNSADY